MSQHSQHTAEFGNADRLEAGDRVMPFTLPDADGRPVNPISDHLAGRPLLLVFEGAPTPETPDAPDFAAELAALAEHADRLQAQNVLVLAITRRSPAENRDLAQTHALPFAVLSDPPAKVAGACGLDPVLAGRAALTVVLDANLRVLAVADGGGAGGWPDIAAALDDVAAPDGVAGAEPAPLGNHAPVLVLPRALTPADCAMLVRTWHQPVELWEGDGFTAAGFHQSQGDFKVRARDYGKVTQYVVRDPALQRYLDAKTRRRVVPEIHKVFDTKVSRREDYRIAGYDGAEGGCVGPHRDNPTRETQHRRFTFCITLNAGEFAGGGLRFPEYSDRPYLVPTGTAIVWSCTLLHEVLPVTSGRRFILGTHLFGN